MNLNRLANSNAQPLITGDIIKAQWAVKPSPVDQRHLVHGLGEATRLLDAAIHTAHREISLLREYRTRLVADVVTGKLDVRNVKFEGGREKEEEDATWFEDETGEDLDEGAEERGDDE